MYAQAMEGGIMLSVWPAIMRLTPDLAEYNQMRVWIQEVSLHFMTVSKVCRALGLESSFPMRILLENEDKSRGLQECQNLFVTTFTQSFSTFGGSRDTVDPILLRQHRRWSLLPIIH
jgi:hypothetical protein